MSEHCGCRWIIRARVGNRWRFLVGPFFSGQRAIGYMDGLVHAGYRYDLQVISRSAAYKPPRSRLRVRDGMRRGP